MNAKTTAPKRLTPGDEISFLASGFSFMAGEHISSGQVSRRGQTVTVTAGLLEANRDRNGVSFVDFVDDPEAQQARYGQVIFQRGPWRAEDDVFIPGSPEAEEERQRQRREAWQLPTEAERSERLSAIERRFGPAPDQTVLIRRGEG